jgi:hypothetical protein
MRILRPEEVTTFPPFRELTPEELKEAYRLARESFRAADLQKYTEVDGGIPIDELLGAMDEGNGRPIHYAVTISAATRAVFDQLHRQAIGAHLGPQFAGAFRKIVDRLRNDPLNFGEPQYRLPALRLLLCQGIVAPLVVDFAAHEDRPVVLIRGFRLLSMEQPGDDLVEIRGPEREDTLVKILRPEEVTAFPKTRELTPEELREAYRLARESFTAADLQKYTELDEGIPFEEVLAELEEAQRQSDQKPQ